MTPLGATLPIDDATLGTVLAAILGSGRTPTSLEILERAPNRYGSTFASEIVTLRIDRGPASSVFVKHGANSPSVDGRRRGVAYEADVYERVLQPLRISSPRLIGARAETETGEHWLVLECLDRAVRADEAPAPHEALVRAARWIGGFHAATAVVLGDDPGRFLLRHDAATYSGLARRTATFAEPWRARLPWLGDLLARVEEPLAEFVRGPVAVIHGEFTPHNVLVEGDRIRPVDWECAAIAPGEIDLASLVDQWPAETASRCAAEYAAARPLDVSPAERARRLDLAGIAWQLRWLGKKPEWTASERALVRFTALREAGERLGLL